MDAVVTLKLKPDEHRLIREAVQHYRDNQHTLATRGEANPRDKSTARVKAVTLGHILEAM
jgi:hypothetical protein